MIKYICIALICFLLLLSALTYWCFNKHWGTIGLFGTATYLTISAYLYLMSTYLFNEAALYWLLIILLIFFIFLSILIERMLLIEKRTQYISYIVLFSAALILIGYARLLLSWSTIHSDYFANICIVAGLCCGTILGLACENSFVHFSTRCFYWYEQFLKIAFGLLVCFLLIYILLCNKNIPAAAFFIATLLTLWICGFSPIFIKKIQHYQYENH